MASVATPIDVRADFPILGDLAYLDSAATAQKPEAVIRAVDDYYRHSNANIHRSVYELAVRATDLYEGARAKAAAFTGWETDTTIFTGNATEAINLVAYAWGRHEVGPGDEVVVTEMDHHSNIVPWQMLCEDTGAKLRWVRVAGDGRLALEDLDGALAGGRVRMVAVTHVSNVLGTVNPVADIAARAHEAGALVLVDGAQAAPQLPLDLPALGADFYAWTGHKALGPTGIGVLHGRRELLQSMRPFIGGGHMISLVGEETSTWNELPWKFEAGTSPIAEAAGMGAALDYLSALGMDNVRAHERALTAYALEKLPEVPGVVVHGPAELDDRGGAVSFSLAGIHPHDVAELLGREKVCVRAGHHCAQPLMRRLGVPATTRASFHVYNHTGDVDRLVSALHHARQVFAL